MTNNQKNIFKIILGVFFIINFFSFKEKIITENELVTKTVTVNHYIQKNKGGGRNSTNIAVKFGTKEYRNAFIIEKSGTKNIEWQLLENIKSGDQLIIKIHKDKVSNLDDEIGDEIPIYTLIKNNKVIYDVEEYNKSKKRFKFNWSFFGLLIGLYLIINEIITYKKITQNPIQKNKNKSK
jgi:hypothetical protein